MLTPYSIRVFLNINKKNHKGLSPLYLRIICNRKKTEISTNILILENQWDKEKLIIKKEPLLNQEISSIVNEVNQWMKKKMESNQLINLTEIRLLVTGKVKTVTSIKNYIEDYKKYIDQQPSLKISSIRQYHTTLTYLLEFLKNKNLDQKPISEVDLKFLLEFDLYLKNIKHKFEDKYFENNTVQKHHSRFRTILLKAMKEDLLEKNPYQHFKLKLTKPGRTFLSQDELNSIIQLDLSHNISLDRVRDIFLFSVYTGLRFEDAQNITRSNINVNADGFAEISLSQRKTGENAKIPLLPPAINIIKKYEAYLAKDGKGQILPKLSNQKTNAYLKVIADLSGITKKLTHHVARHTCATTILLSNEVPIEAVSGWLGHTNIKTTQIYAKITENYLHKMAQKVSLKIKNFE